METRFEQLLKNDFRKSDISYSDSKYHDEYRDRYSDRYTDYDDNRYGDSQGGADYK